MSTAMPVLETGRLTIRPLVLADLEAADRVLSNAWDVPPAEQARRRPRRERWLRWTIESYEELAGLNQPPYGDRAVVRKEDGRLVGCVGLVPALGPFGQLPGFPGYAASRSWHPEVGLFWAVDPDQQRKGYATEAAWALVDFAFDELNLGRIVATTEFDNDRSMAVMRKLEMRIFRNPWPEPPWFQVVGVLVRAGAGR